MVVFTCNACGDSLKKNQVEKHYTTKCRRCDMLSCVDCGKDFWGEEYQTHTKCISEEEKYSGKNYKPKPNANKGEVKQSQWTEVVQDAIDKNKGNPKLSRLLERLKDYPNIPRKRSKFENFVQSSLNMRDKVLTAQVWDVLMATKEQNKPIEQTKEKTDDENSHVTQNGQSNQEKEDDTDDKETKEKKKSKREKKEERRRKAEKLEKKDKSEKVDSESNDSQSNEKKKKHKTCDENDESLSKEKKKKKKDKKRKREEKDDKEAENVVKKKKKKKERKGKGDMSVLENKENDQTTADDEDVVTSTTKFDWINVITTLLKSKGEMPLKKMRKKVIAEYMSQCGNALSEEKLRSKFNKKVTKNPTFVVHKERVKLRERK